jgi:hypothetical protein
MGSNWFTSMFSGSPGSQDVIKAGPLNATKIVAIVTVVATSLAAASKPIFGTDGPLASLSGGQRLILWIGVLALVTVLVIVDMVVRGFVTARVSAAEENAPVVWFNPTRRARSVAASGGDPGGSVVALRRTSDDISGIQYLVVRDPVAGVPIDTPSQTAWVGASLLVLE